MFIITIFTLIFFVYINYHLYRQDFIAPAVIFPFALLCPALYALFWYNLWDLNTYSIKTYFVILISLIFFSFSSRIIYSFMNGEKILKIKTKFDRNLNIDSKIPISTGKGKLLFVLFLELITLKMALSFFLSYGDNLSSAIITYRVNFVNGGERMPRGLSILLNCLMVSSYYSSYIFINNLLCAKKIEFGWFIAFLGGLLLSLFGGSRGGAVSIVFVAAGIFYVIYQHNPRKISKKKLQLKFFRILIVFIVIGFVFFVASAAWIGRTNNFSPFYYFAIYLSAPLKNLDLYIPIIDSGIKELGFMDVNGASLGNVGTVLAYEYQQGGFIGVMCMSSLSSIVCTLIYIYMRKCQYESKKINFSLIFYSYIFYSICIVMFGSTSFTSVFSFFFVKIFFAMVLMNYLFNLNFDIKSLVWKIGKSYNIFCLR